MKGASRLLLVVASLVVSTFSSHVLVRAHDISEAALDSATASGIRRRSQETATTPSPPKVGSVIKLRLINADTDKPIPAYDPLPTTATIDISTLPTKNLNIEAIASSENGESVQSLQWNVNGEKRTENNPLWALCGNSGANFMPCGSAILKIGTELSISATPFAQGASGRGLSISLTLVPGIKAPTRAPAKSPTLAPAKSPTRAPVTPPTPTPPTGAMSLTLMNADTDVELAPVMINDTVIDLAVTPKVNIRANVGPGIASVQFSTNGVVSRTDDGAPFSYNGNRGSDYFAWTPVAGRYTVTAAAHGNTNARGPILSKSSVTFTVVGKPSAPTSIRPPTRAPAVAPVTVPSSAAPMRAPTVAPIVVIAPTSPPAPAPVAIADNTPPKLLGFKRFTEFVDVSFGPGTTVVALKVQDDQAGLKQVVVGPPGFEQTYEVPSGTNTGSNVVEFNVTLVFPQSNAEPPDGTYHWIPVSLTDNAMNTVTLSESDLDELGIRDAYVIVTKATQVLNFTALSPTKVDVSGASVFLTFLVKVQSLPLDVAKLTATSPEGNIVTTIKPNGVEPGVQAFFMTLHVPANSRPTTYALSLDFVNVEGYTTSLNDFELESRGLPSKIEVINDKVDLAPPKLLDFTIQPRTAFNRTAGNRVVNVTVALEDEQSGTTEVWVQIYASGDRSLFVNSNWTKPVVGVSTFSAVFNLDDEYLRIRGKGTYFFTVYAWDFNRNQLEISSDELAERGFNATVTIL